MTAPVSVPLKDEVDGSFDRVNHESIAPASWTLHVVAASPASVYAMSTRLPSRYEDLDPAFRGRLRPDRALIDLVKRSAQVMTISGGVRFLALYGKSGCGKSSAVRELTTHLPECHVVVLSRAAVTDPAQLVDEIASPSQDHKLTIAIVDQYEEASALDDNTPQQFVEGLSVLGPYAMNAGAAGSD